MEGYSEHELNCANLILNDLSQHFISQGVNLLRSFTHEVFEAIPEKKRQSRGITWVLQRVSKLLIETCQGEEQKRDTALTLYHNLVMDDILMGVPIFMMGEYGILYPQEVFDFFQQVAKSENWMVREFAQAGFRFLIFPNQGIVHPWLYGIAQSDNPLLRRFVGETLRPVAQNQWMQQEPDYSLSILRLLFRESNPYPRTSVGNNLSDLSRKNPERIFSVIHELVYMEDKNSYWIAYRACRNLVKIHPQRVLDLLGVDEYHYKDRNFYRS